jgi:hypothetical protein
LVLDGLEPTYSVRIISPFPGVQFGPTRLSFRIGSTVRFATILTTISILLASLTKRDSETDSNRCSITAVADKEEREESRSSMILYTVFYPLERRSSLLRRLSIRKCRNYKCRVPVTVPTPHQFCLVESSGERESTARHHSAITLNTR